MNYCSKCGAEIPEGCKFCIKCGAPVSSKGASGDVDTATVYESTVNQSTSDNMRWYKFTIYAGVFIYAVIYLGLAVLCATGYMYLNNRESVYEAYPGMQPWNIVMAAFYVIMAVMAIVVRQRLAHFRKNGPRLYIGWMCASLIGWFAYDMVSSMIIGRFTIYIYPLSLQWFAIFIGAAVLVNAVYIIFNAIYFYRRDRKALFVN